MKKIKKIYLVLFLIICCSLVKINDVYANEMNLEFYPRIDEEKLDLIDDLYQLNNINELNVYYKISPSFVNKDKCYRVIIKKEEVNKLTTEFCGNSFVNPSIEHTLSGKEIVDINYDKDITNYKIYLYEADDDNWHIDNNKKLLVEKSFDVKFNKFDEISFIDTRLNIVEISQAGEVVNPVIDGNEVKYVVNNLQEYQIKLKGENFKNDLEYVFSENNYDGKVYTGKELNEGITITVRDDNYSDKYVSSSAINEFGLNGFLMNKDITYKDELGNYYSVLIYSEEEQNLPDFQTTINYTNYKDVDINWLVLGKYHDKDNSLTLKIDGVKFINEDTYDIDIVVVKNNKEVYSKKLYEISGNNLNDGYSVELDGFVSKLSDNLDDAFSSYIVYTKINYTTKQSMYMYREEQAYLNTSLFYEDGQKNISTVAGSGEELGTIAMFRVDDKFFDNDMYLHVLGEGFNNNIEYNYEVYYFNRLDVVSYDSFEEKTKNLILNGKVNGKNLNRKGLLLEISNDNSYSDPGYVIVIKKEDKIVQFHQVIFNYNNGEMLSSATLKSNSRNLYIDMRDFDYNYIVTKDSKLDIVLEGRNYEDDKDYKFKVSLCYLKLDEGSHNSYSQVCDEEKEYILNGKKLNKGNAFIKYEDEIDYSYKNYIFVIVDSKGNYNCINLDFVDSNKYFSKDKKYIIDNANYLIKSIKKNTSVNDFVGNTSVDDGSIKIYDKNGVEEIDGSVGTGMIARIVDEYDRSLLDMDVVVKGDVTGDGNISITDLIKVRQHLANINKLDGVYEMAGDTTDTGTIGITDLIKIRQDLAKIAELN